jgi:Fic family protein
MSAQRGGLVRPGTFRTVQNWIGSPRSSIESATYVPPPLELLMRCLSDWERFVNDRGSMPDLVQCAIMHEWFESIHPAGVEATTRAAAQQTTRILDLRADYYRRLRGKANALALIDVLFGNPYITAARAASLLGVSDPTARNAIVTLEANHTLEEITGRSWGRVYRCTAILDAISRREIASSR